MKSRFQLSQNNLDFHFLGIFCRRNDVAVDLLAVHIHGGDALLHMRAVIHSDVVFHTAEHTGHGEAVHSIRNARIDLQTGQCGLDAEDILGFTSYDNAKAILFKYNIEL